MIRGDEEHRVHSAAPADTRPLLALSSWPCMIVLVLLGFLFSFRSFFPALTDIWLFDEAYYIDKGRLLLSGTFPVLAENPLLAALWALAILPFSASNAWMLHAVSAVRIFEFVLLWFAVFQIARELSEATPPLLTLLLLLVTPSLFTLLDNSSDAFFAGVSGIALWQMIKFDRTRLLRHLFFCAFLLALSALIRNDGLVLGVIAGMLSILIVGKRVFVGKALLIFGIPFLCIVGGYILIHALNTGDSSIGTGRRLYDAFEQGEGMAYGPGDGEFNPYIQGYVDARERYGSPEENQYSVIRAIAGNPRAFIRRLIHVSSQLPAQAFTAYGKGFRGIGALILLLAIRGILSLFRTKRITTAVILLVWPLHLTVYFVTFFREGYFLLPVTGVFILAACGTQSIFNTRNLNTELMWCGISLALMAVYALLMNNLLLLAPLISFLVGLILIVIIGKAGEHRISHEVIRMGGPLTVIMLFALQAHFCRPARCSPPPIPRFGSGGDEQAAVFMINHLPEHANVGTYTLAPVILARTNPVPMFSGIYSFVTAQELMTWIIETELLAVYVDDLFRTMEPTMYRLLQSCIGNGMEYAWIDSSGIHEVLAVSETLPYWQRIP